MSLYYKFSLDTLRNGLFTGYANDITSYVKNVAWSFGLGSPYDNIGTTAYLEMTLDNRAGDFALENTSAKYYGKVRKGTLIRVEMSRNGSTWTTMASLKIDELLPTYTNSGDHDVTLKASDRTTDFFKKEFTPPLQTNVRIDTALQTMHNKAVMIWPYESYYQFIGHSSIGDGRAPYYGADATSFETAETTLVYLGDNLDRGQGVTVSQYLRDALSAEVYGVYWFSPRDGKFHFLSRYHASDTAVSWYLTDKMMPTPQFSNGRYLVNEYTLSYYPRSIGAAGSVLFSADNVPFSISAQSTKVIKVKYRDPNNESATVGALTVIPPVLGVDIIGNSASDGSGSNWTQYIVPSFELGQSQSEISLYIRKVGDPVYITTLQVRGTPITTYNKEQITVINDDSIVGPGSDVTQGNDRVSQSESFFAVSDYDFAKSIADFKVNTFGQPSVDLERVTINIYDGLLAAITPAELATIETNVISKTIGDIINITDNKTSHNKDYMIVGENHSADPRIYNHTVNYTLRPVNRGELFILGESFYDDGDSLSF